MGSDVFCDNGTRGNNSSAANRYARENHCASSDEHIVIYTNWGSYAQKIGTLNIVRCSEDADFRSNRNIATD
jgi:hypothetical protein